MIKILLKDSIKLLRFATIAKLCGMKIERRGEKSCNRGTGGRRVGERRGARSGSETIQFQSIWEKREKKCKFAVG